MEIKTEIQLKNCTITKDGVICDIDQENHQKMMEQKIIPNDLTINLEKKIPKNKSIDSSKRTEETKNKQGCGCSVSTENAKTSTPDAKIAPENERFGTSETKTIPEDQNTDNSDV